MKNLGKVKVNLTEKSTPKVTVYIHGYFSLRHGMLGSLIERLVHCYISIHTYIYIYIFPQKTMKSRQSKGNIFVKAVSLLSNTFANSLNVLCRGKTILKAEVNLVGWLSAVH
jgi:hypothetical protein